MGNRALFSQQWTLCCYMFKPRIVVYRVTWPAHASESFKTPAPKRRRRRDIGLFHPPPLYRGDVLIYVCVLCILAGKAHGRLRQKGWSLPSLLYISPGFIYSSAGSPLCTRFLHLYSIVVVADWFLLLFVSTAGKNCLLPLDGGRLSATNRF